MSFRALPQNLRQHGDQIRVFLQQSEQLLHVVVDGFCFLLRCVECRLKFFGSALPVLIDDVRVDVCDHVDLRAPRVALHRLNIALVELQLVGRAGVAQAVEHHRGSAAG